MLASAIHGVDGDIRAIAGEFGPPVVGRPGPRNAKAFDAPAREFSMARALAILEGIRGAR